MSVASVNKRREMALVTEKANLIKDEDLAGVTNESSNPALQQELVVKVVPKLNELNNELKELYKKYDLMKKGRMEDTTIIKQIKNKEREIEKESLAITRRKKAAKEQAQRVKTQDLYEKNLEKSLKANQNLVELEERYLELLVEINKYKKKGLGLKVQTLEQC